MAVVAQREISASASARPTFSSRGVAVRLFFTCWLVFALHFSPFVVRELYLVLSLSEKHSVRVDEYLDLHVDLFGIPGRGVFMGGNPGAAFLAAVPYALALPVVNRVAPVRLPKTSEPVSTTYNEERVNRRAFYEKVRQRGLDVRLGLAAMITSIFFMAPLSALGAVVMYRLLGRFGFGETQSLWLALLYAFGTPIFFRTATLSLNLVVALASLFSFALLCFESGEKEQAEPRRYFLAGVLAGWAVLTDFSGMVPVVLLGFFALSQQKRDKPFWPALRRSLWYVGGALGPVLFLLFYQWYCYGNPWLPAQYYQPKIYYLGYPSERGVGKPLPAALWNLLFDPLYGLLVFAPIFAAVLYHLVLWRRRQTRIPANVAVFCWAFFALLWVFFSCIHYTLRHQWQDGFRYMIPAIPFLFLLLADVLARMPRALAYLLALAAVVETWCLAMVRENPLESVARVLLHGFELPWLTTLVKAAAQYFPVLAEGASPVGLFLVCGVLIWGIWRLRAPWRPVDSGWEKV